MLPEYANEPAFFDPKTKKAYLVKGKANKTSAIHEIFTHPFLLQIEKTNPTLYKNLLKEAKNNKSVVDYVDNFYGTNQNNDHEYITRAIDLAVQGELDQQKDKTLLERIQDFFNQLYDYLKKLFNIPEVFSSAISPNITLQQLTQFAMYGKGKMDLNPAQENIEYSLKATSVIVKNLDKIKQWEKNKSINEDVLWNKIQGLGVPKEQLELIKNSEGNTVEEKLLDFTNQYSYAVEINISTKNEIGVEVSYNPETGEVDIDNIEPNFDYIEEYDDDGNIIGMKSVLSEKGKKQLEEKPTQHYSYLTVPGGTNYTENKIETPAITPSIQGHPAWVKSDGTDKGIGWFRSDDKAPIVEGFVENKEAPKEWGLEDAVLKEEPKTRRILEVQSDLFQKGRDEKKALAWNRYILDSKGDVIGENPNFQSEQDFLNLLRKDNNWVTFFIKSIIQDSAKKGYEKVLFPSGKTVEKIEGFNRITEELERINNNIEKHKKLINDKQGENIGNDVAKLDELEKEKQHFLSAQKDTLSTVNFYENTVINILKKQGYNPVEVTDEYGNTWNEITIDENRDNQNIVFQKTPQERLNQVQKLFESNPELANEVYEVLGFDISNAKIESLNKLNTHLESYLKQFGFKTEQLDDLKQATGYSIIGATDFLEKTIFVQKENINKAYSKEAAYAIFNLLGKKNLLRKDLIASIHLVDNYESLKSQYANSKLSDYKIRELIAIDYLQNKLIEAHKEVLPTTNKAVSKDVTAKNKLEYITLRIKKWWSDIIRKFFKSYKRNYIEDVFNQIANDIINNNTRLFNLSKEVSYKKMELTGVQKEINDNLVKLGAINSGSYSLNRQGTLTRESINDLDYFLPYEIKDEFIKNVVKKYPQAVFSEPYSGVMGNRSLTLSLKINDVKIDFFLPTSQEESDKNKIIVIDGVKYHHWKNIFDAKIRIGSKKHLSDLAGFTPFNKEWSVYNINWRNPLTLKDDYLNIVRQRHYNFDFIQSKYNYKEYSSDENVNKSDNIKTYWDKNLEQTALTYFKDNNIDFEKSIQYQNLLSYFNNKKDKAITAYYLTFSENFKKFYGNIDSRKDLPSFIINSVSGKYSKNSILLDEHGDPVIFYHGAGTKFDKFSKDYFLSGEGAMAYGAGFYSTNYKPTADNYRDTSKAAMETFRKLLEEQNKQLLELIEKLKIDINEENLIGLMRGSVDIEDTKSKTELLNLLGLTETKALYIALTNPLYWQKDISKENKNLIESHFGVKLKNNNSGQIYRELQKTLKISDKELSARLYQIGIDGVIRIAGGGQAVGGFSHKKGEKHIIFFEPIQAKAVNNSGLFSLNNENMYDPIEIKDIDTNKNKQITPEQKATAQQLYSQYFEQNPNGSVEQFKSWVDNNQSNIQYQLPLQKVSDSSFQQFQQSLNKPNTNPILQGNQQEQVKKFAELQERLSNKEFLEGAKFAFESSAELQNVYYEALVPKNFTRLYRAENEKGVDSPAPSWVLEQPEVIAQQEAQGRWFYKSYEEAKYHADKFGSSGISYIDVPTTDVENYNAKNNKFAGGYGKEGKEYFVSKELANNRKSFEPQKQEALNAYTDYIARVSLGIIKNPSSGEYNYESQVKDIVYRGDKKGLDNFTQIDDKGNFKASKYGFDYGIFLSSDKEYVEKEYGEVVYSTVINSRNITKTSTPLQMEVAAAIFLPNELDPTDMPGWEDLDDSEKDKVYQDYLNNREKDKIDTIIGNDSDSQGVSFRENIKGLEYVVYKPEQIHILGSKQDIEGFREFVSDKNNASKENNTIVGKIDIDYTIPIFENPNEFSDEFMNHC